MSVKAVIDFANKTEQLVKAEAVEMTPEEIKVMESEIRKAELMEKSRSLTESEVSRMFIAQNINNLTVDDNTALRMIDFYPEWTANTSYSVGFKVQRNDKLWKVLQAHTSVDGWQPENTPSLWEEINETHTGTIDDPIPYNGNMRLEDGKHYVQNYVIYLCNRDTINPVYHPLADLVGLYVVTV